MTRKSETLGEPESIDSGSFRWCSEKIPEIKSQRFPLFSHNLQKKLSDLMTIAFESIRYIGYKYTIRHEWCLKRKPRTKGTRTMSNVTLRNDFHNTSTTLRCETLSHVYHTVTIYPSVSQIRRAKKALCGISGCTCSDDAGCRGPQLHNGKRLVVDLSSLYAQ